MAIRKYKPTTPGRRGSSVADFAEITRSTPEKSLLRPLSELAVARQFTLDDFDRHDLVVARVRLAGQDPRPARVRVMVDEGRVAQRVDGAAPRELGRAEGLGSDFSGPFAKPQRMAAITAGAVLSAIELGCSTRATPCLSR